MIAVVLVPALVISVSIVGTLAGLALVVAAIGIARLLGELHRRVLRRATGERVTAPVPFRPGSGMLGGLGRRLRDRDGWRAAGYTGVKLPIAIAEGYAVATTAIGLADFAYPLFWLLFRTHPEPGERQGPMIAVAPVPNGHWAIETLPGTLSATLAGIVCILAGLWLARGITTVDARAMRFLLGPSRVSVLEGTRAIAVEDAAAALRRVERDLHDGAQVRLAAVAMNLGMAQEKAVDDTLRELLDAAQTGVSGALADLRRIARGIHPPVLDSGLAEALASLAATSPIPAQVRAAVADAEALLAAVIEHPPDAVIADIRMPPTHTDEGLRAALTIRHDFPSTGVLLFSQYIETRYTARLLESGAGGVGYLLKDRVGNVANFVSALERVATGGTALDPEVISQLLRKPDPGLASLTPRERGVLGLMAEGRSNSGIAGKLVLSEGAVEKHIASIFGKLSLDPEPADNRRVLAVLRYLS